MIQSDNGYAQSGFGMAQGTATCGLTGKKQVFAAEAAQRVLIIVPFWG
jgi:hypothetical protein